MRYLTLSVFALLFGLRAITGEAENAVLDVAAFKAMGGKIYGNSLFIGEDWKGKNDGLLRLVALSGITTLYLESPNVTEEALQAVASMPNLTSLHLKKVKLGPKGMSALGTLPKLDHLEIGIDELKTFELRGVKTLRELRVQSGDLESVTLKQLPLLDTLQIAKIDFRTMSPADVAIEEAPKLRALLLRGYDIRGLSAKALENVEIIHLTAARLPPELLPKLSELAYLHKFGISNVKLTTADCDALRGIKGLTSLELGKVELNDEGLGFLKAMTRLETLEMRECAISDTEFEAVKDLKYLTAVTLDVARGFTGKGLAALGNSRKLKYLSLRFTGTTDAGLENLKGFDELATLVLMSTPVTDEGLDALKTMTRMKNLFLDHTKISDAGMAKLAGLTRMEHLSLNHTQVGDAGLAHLAKMNDLWTLRVGSTKITKAGVEKLRALPKLRYVDFSNTDAKGMEKEFQKGK